MSSQNFLDTLVTVTIDRPLGSRHPKHGYIYPINYGYLAGTLSGDGEALDAYILGVFEPKSTFTGTCIAIVHRINDTDDKLIIIPEGGNYTDTQIQALTEFQEQYFTSTILRGEKKNQS